MTSKLIQKIEKEQFNLEQTAMAKGLLALGISKQNRIEILRYFGWLCFDRILLEHHNSENLQKQNRIHCELYENALEQALTIAKPSIKKWNKAGHAILCVYRNSIQR